MAHDGDTLAEDWVALWQSEMAAMAADRELRESWTGLLALWAGAVGAALQLAPEWRGFDAAVRNANGAAGAAQPAGAPPAAAASDLSGDEARRLYERIAELESRLSTFERRRGGKPARPGKP